jgi:hypothetical protein
VPVSAPAPTPFGGWGFFRATPAHPPATTSRARLRVRDFACDDLACDPPPLASPRLASRTPTPTLSFGEGGVGCFPVISSIVALCPTRLARPEYGVARAPARS